MGVSDFRREWMPQTQHRVRLRRAPGVQLWWELAVSLDLDLDLEGEEEHRWLHLLRPRKHKLEVAGSQPILTGRLGSVG